MVTPPYGKQVLVGNWMDRRYTSDEKTNGILPGLSPCDHCEQHRSLSQDTYTNKRQDRVELERYFVEKRATQNRHFYEATTSNVKLMDTDELRDNYTTTNTLVYDLLPRLRQELASTKSQPARGRSDTDMLQCFGNLTQTRNFAKQFEYERILDKQNHMQTSYSSAYTLKKSS
ncbi:GH16767 [Drosophila grimshawi]|uniref:GH16767 n=1 Tax=Drosophila grimshawi TaxID=7222 RepID=B4J3Q8_DROGR|nr:GH16767 [Drosophila grimshawi]